MADLDYKRGFKEGWNIGFSDGLEQASINLGLSIDDPNKVFDTPDKNECAEYKKGWEQGYSEGSAQGELDE
jgi:flagellar biosynthesis/type III secretory pathway protein FliH